MLKGNELSKAAVKTHDTITHCSLGKVMLCDCSTSWEGSSAAAAAAYSDHVAVKVHQDPNTSIQGNKTVMLIIQNIHNM